MVRSALSGSKSLINIPKQKQTGIIDCFSLMDITPITYTRGFLEYARMHKILVLCYPAHTTHVIQGLDVVVFATVKQCLGEERDAWEQQTGERISKTNFLGIYGRAHLRTLTSENIKASFRKTGVWPFDPSVVTNEMMAPSKETSCEGHLLVVRQ